VLFRSTKLEAAITSSTFLALIHASGASGDGVDKLNRRWRAVAAASGREPIIQQTFDVEQISLALGRSNVVHAGLSRGGAAANFLAQAAKLTAFRANSYALPGAPSPANASD
jgi:hypothetical protein